VIITSTPGSTDQPSETDVTDAETTEAPIPEPDSAETTTAKPEEEGSAEPEGISKFQVCRKLRPNHAWNRLHYCFE
jgi:hypothetical protein